MCDESQTGSGPTDCEDHASLTETTRVRRVEDRHTAQVPTVCPPVPSEAPIELILGQGVDFEEP